MNRFILKCFLFLFCFQVSISKITFGQPTDSSNVTIIFAGDIMTHIPVLKAAYDPTTGSYDFQQFFKFIKPYIQKSDLAIGNLETTLGGKPYSGYPQFSTPDDIVIALKDIGFKVLVTANNHCIDRGKKGLERTIRMLDSLGIKHTGTFLNPVVRDSLYPLIIDVKGLRLAILNYTYGTNGLPTEPPNVVNIIDTVEIKRDIQKAHEKSDYTIAVMHWGKEYERYPNAGQQALAKWLSQNGCDAIIGSHPHVVETFQYFYANSADSSWVQPVIYSLGNFISNQRDRYKDGGIIFKLVLDLKNKPKVKECSYLSFWVYKGNLNGKYQYWLIPTGLYEHNKEYFQLPAKADSAILQFDKDTREILKNLPEDKNFDFIINP